MSTGDVGGRGELIANVLRVKQEVDGVPFRRVSEALGELPVGAVRELYANVPIVELDRKAGEVSAGRLGPDTARLNGELADTLRTTNNPNALQALLSMLDLAQIGNEVTTLTNEAGGAIKAAKEALDTALLELRKAEHLTHAAEQQARQGFAVQLDFDRQISAYVAEI